MPALTEKPSSLTHRPEGRWEFDEAVTSCFDDMLARSIPQYEVMRGLCYDLACRYRKKGQAIVDLGCSRGEALHKLIDRYGAANRFVGVEVSPPMLEAARARFAGLIDCGVVSIQEIDLRHDYPRDLACVTLAVLTLQFTPIEYRQQIVRRAFEQTAPGGALIVVEKILGASADLDNAFVERYLRHKAEQGYGLEEITRKRSALEGVLVPVTREWNLQLLHGAGFRQVDTFWQWMNFAGFIAVKGD